MAITAIQLYDPDFLSQLSSEYICTGFMFDKNIQMESLESKLSKGGFIPGVDIQEAKKTFAKMDLETNIAEELRVKRVKEQEGRAAAASQVAQEMYAAEYAAEKKEYAAKQAAAALTAAQKKAKLMGE